MSALRRLAQTNHAVAATNTDSPIAASPSTPIRNGARPTTPRTKLVYPPSPLTSPSLSASTPFDWEAARARRPPPYASPLARRARGLRNASDPDGMGTPAKQAAKRVVRKKSFIEKITSIPSTVAFHMALFPNNVPLPTPQKSAWIIGGIMHLLHFIVRIAQITKVPDSDLGWEDMYKEDEGDGWFDWTTPVTILLMITSIANAFYLFTRTRMYQLSLAKDPVGSPNAKFVPREQPEAQEKPARGPLTIIFAIIRHFWRAFSVSVRFLLNMSPPKDRQISANRTERVQQLEVWTPGELELALFPIYSPVHAFLWMALTSANWISMSFIMFIVGVQLRALVKSFQALLKDRSIISAEVLHEYDEKFVYPRINPIRHDVAVMTHQAEMVNAWD